MTDASYEPSLYEYGLDADYGARLHLLHERLFKRIRWAATVLQLASVTAILGPYLSGKEHPVIAGVGGAILVAITIVDAATDFAGKAYAHRAMRCAYEELSGKISAMTLSEVRAALSYLSAKDETMCFEGLRVPAYNDNLRRHGRESYIRGMTKWQKFLAALA